MEIVKWRAEYATLVAEFDEEHKQIVRLINELYNGLKQEQAEEVVKDALRELVEYTHFHFDHEERLMRRFLYPGYTEQKRQHDSFRSTINDINAMVEQGVTGMGLPLLQMLREWLVTHILEVDKKYGTFFRDKGFG
ncbi:hypothetical protein C2E25_09790 [Geothermobacter hydrogeniphilus]|uniref:Hemerythrin-like domain-containing protein n=1 Tax=Geothermobacter hydrogeniphilus TaxID=1969733 RepID=A0A2K2H9P2_9BACT|nr:bacteriohemerythrin [Geothermobacter hydrogeniphilus]PNU19953.1 hypothetical protein C2E25_09790 [Geothermobacter hydrogeniphilus]